MNRILFTLLVCWGLTPAAAAGTAAAGAKAAVAETPAPIQVASLNELAEYAGKNGNTVRMKPGVYRMSDYLTDDVIRQVRTQVAPGPGRVPVWMIRFSGSNNDFDLRDVVLEIDTTLYPKLPRGYTRCLFVSGSNNRIHGLTIRNTGPNQGSGGNILSIFGDANRLEDLTLHVSGSRPYGYGDLLGKGGPNLVGLQKQSGIMIAGRDSVVRRCRVISRAFGHCFYVQQPDGITTDNVRLEGCYAEGVMRSTADMLRETDGPLHDLNFGAIAANRDGRFLVVAGYMKSLVEDGFRTYGGTGRVTLINCTALNTRAGFEANGPDEGSGKTIIDGANAIGCERAFLLGSNVQVRNSRGDTQYGPLLYLRGGHSSDIELQWTGQGSDYTVHALATIAGEGHRVRLSTPAPELQRDSAPATPGRARAAPAVPIMLGFAMPAAAEMASPIRPAAAKNVTLISDLPRIPIIRSPDAIDCTIKTPAAVLSDEQTRHHPQRPPSSRPAHSTPTAPSNPQK